MQRTITLMLTLAVTSVTSTYSQESTAEIVYYCPPCGCTLDGNAQDSPGLCEECNMTMMPRYSGGQLESIPFVPLRVGILLFHGADIMDVTGPWSVFEHASTRVITVAKTTDMVRLGMTMQIKPDYTLEAMPEVDVLVLPGGGPAESNQDPEIVKWVQNQYQKTDYMLSVCSGAFFLGKAGLLEGLEATTFASLLPALASEFPKTQVRDDVKFTTNGKIFTTAGLSSGIEGAFQVIAHHYGQGQAQDVANHMEYNWQQNNTYSRPQLADNFVRPLQPLARLFSSQYLESSGNRDTWTYAYELQPQIAPGDVLDALRLALGKMEAWTLKSADSQIIRGQMTTKNLGRAQVTLSTHEADGSWWLTITANKVAGRSDSVGDGQ